MRDGGIVSVEARHEHERILLEISGTLDSTTYRHVRDSVIKAALEEPDVVMVDVTGLDAPSTSAWTVFASARWHVSTWPDVPVLLICRDADRRASIARSAVTRYVPIYAATPSRSEIAVSRRDLRRRARAELPADFASLRQARQLISDWLAAWDRSEMALTASTVATILIENVLDHTTSDPALAVEAKGDTITVAVRDDNPLPAVRHEDPGSGAHTVSGLAIITALSRAWGNTPTADGKTVWALLGSENHL
ncbi:STAS domain-containing protein [Mycobacterium sp. SMC-4]|uniref:STAS domain-containing protein n=1 Tax=Mycobacterium sp. SMC-4 TaxID=2857059 RepID=UPI003CFEE9DC